MHEFSGPKSDWLLYHFEGFFLVSKGDACNTSSLNLLWLMCVFLCHWLDNLNDGALT